MDLGTVLGLWAHPDDDIYLSAGLMAMNVGLGNRVVDVTATRGEGGSMDEERWPPETMADVRSVELMQSLEVLGVSEHRFLEGPVDIDMDAPLDESGAAQVIEIMAEVQPDTVLTFGPDGMTGHVGHMSVSRWATEAFHAVAKPGAQLHYATMTPWYVEEFAEIFEPLNIFRPGTPPVTPPDQLSIDLALQSDLLERKWSSIMQHISQVQYIFDAVGEDTFKREMAHEWFRLAAVKA
ncbi:MAG: PIG-L deacetylase family protein [Actinomycetota bacterium]